MKFIIRLINILRKNKGIKKNCSNCISNKGDYCDIGDYYAKKGVKAICFNGEMWRSNSPINIIDSSKKKGDSSNNSK